MPLRHRVHEGTALTNALQTLLTFGDNLVEAGAITWGFGIFNDDTVDHVVRVYIVPTGLAAGVAYLKFKGNVPAGEGVTMSGPWHNASGAFIQAISDAAVSNTSISVTATEEYAQG